MRNLGNKIIEKIFGSYLSKWQIKIILALFAFLIVLAVILYTQNLVDRMIEREKRVISFYAAVYERYVNTLVHETDEYADKDYEEGYDDFFFYLDNITPAISFPVIMTDDKGVPFEPFANWTMNIEIDTSLTLAQQRRFFANYKIEMSEQYDPIIVKSPDGKALSHFYYTHSAMVENLRFFPIFAIIIVGAFIVVGYIAFNSIRRGEETKVWVGMAKEAAHQLGTPLSSLLAWMEIVKMNKNNPEMLEVSLSEMENDIDRLNAITTRFSKIGSMPQKELTNLAHIIEKVAVYFEKRLPNIGKRIDIQRNLKESVYVEVNANLFEWVFENLFKNAAEAIEEREGQIRVSMYVIHDKKCVVIVHDTGKGMNARQKRQAFNPGFTSKKRGWGLGLSLCKRIVEQYHNGRIYIKESGPGKGTSFALELKLPQPE